MPSYASAHPEGESPSLLLTDGGAPGVIYLTSPLGLLSNASLEQEDVILLPESQEHSLGGIDLLASYRLSNVLQLPSLSSLWESSTFKGKGKGQGFGVRCLHTKTTSSDGILDTELTIRNLDVKGKGFLGYERMVELCEFLDLFTELKGRDIGSKKVISK